MGKRENDSKKRERPPNVPASESVLDTKSASAKIGSTSDALVGFDEKLWHVGAGERDAEVVA